MDIDRLKELSRQRIEAQPRVEERERLGTEIETVIETLRDLISYENWDGTRTFHPASVNLSEPTDDQDGRSIRMVATIFEYNWDEILTIHLANQPVEKSAHIYGENLGSIPVATKLGSWNDPLPSPSGGIEFRLSDEDLAELHSTVMAIGTAASDPALNEKIASKMGEVMQQFE